MESDLIKAYRDKLGEEYGEIIDYAIAKHAGQTRKGGNDFVLHPLYVASIIKLYNGSPSQICAGLLHDVVEDTDTTFVQLKEDLSKMKILNDIKEMKRLKITTLAYPDVIVYYVSEMTNVFTKENYPNLNRKERKKREIAKFKLWNEPDLKLIKYADIISNLSDIDSIDTDFAKVYLREDMQIISALQYDHPIYDYAVNILFEAIGTIYKRDENGKES